MGELLASQYDVDTIPSMKIVFNVLFPDRVDLWAALDDRRLWTLSQQRNFIVHRRGIVDSQYQKATGATLPIGAELTASPEELECYMRSCCSVVRELLLAVSGGSTTQPEAAVLVPPA
jgi:hypothetical protein